ncbi:hypothetical protein LR69_00898 [Geobacillus sp. BCO2]|nr:hypothetical protein LR69_00898 [Geobacillus sp. BCO2]
MMAWLYALLASRPVVWLLLFVNAAGTIYGYYWYRYQLADTPPVFLPFVPDSPTASLFFLSSLWHGFSAGRRRFLKRWLW